MKRSDGRLTTEIRKTEISLGFQSSPEGSALIEAGNTKVLCAASIEERVPSWRRGSGKGWITAEYGMLPGSTTSRVPREVSAGSVRGRSREIQRLIGRALRAVTDLSALGERTIVVDCDVIQADGSTRTTAVTGAYVALYQALYRLTRINVLPEIPLKYAVAAVSVGEIENSLLLDLMYDEDFSTSVDFNIVMTEQGDLVEVQAAGEQGPFGRKLMEDAIEIAGKGIQELVAIQRRVLSGIDGLG